MRSVMPQSPKSREERGEHNRADAIRPNDLVVAFNSLDAEKHMEALCEKVIQAAEL